MLGGVGAVFGGGGGGGYRPDFGFLGGRFLPPPPQQTVPVTLPAGQTHTPQPLLIGSVPPQTHALKPLRDKSFRDSAPNFE